MGVGSSLSCSTRHAAGYILNRVSSARTPPRLPSPASRAAERIIAVTCHRQCWCVRPCETQLLFMSPVLYYSSIHGHQVGSELSKRPSSHVMRRFSDQVLEPQVSDLQTSTLLNVTPCDALHVFKQTLSTSSKRCCSFVPSRSSPSRRPAHLLVPT